MTSGVNAPFIWGANGEQLTPEQIRRGRKSADALLASGTDMSPIAHPMQGVARVAQAMAGAYKNNLLDKAEQANNAYDDAWRKKVFGNGFGFGSLLGLNSSGGA